MWKTTSFFLNSTLNLLIGLLNVAVFILISSFALLALTASILAGWVAHSINTFIQKNNTKNVVHYIRLIYIISHLLYHSKYVQMCIATKFNTWMKPQNPSYFVSHAVMNLLLESVGGWHRVAPCRVGKWGVDEAGFFVGTLGQMRRVVVNHKEGRRST